MANINNPQVFEYPKMNIMQSVVPLKETDLLKQALNDEIHEMQKVNKSMLPIVNNR